MRPYQRRLSEIVARLIPQFFAVASRTMLADDGWRFCEIGEMIERAIITANAVHSISRSFAQPERQEQSRDHTTEIELSAFLRLLGTRDAYRRIYQMRAEPIRVLEMLWQNADAPRSILFCLERCAGLLRASSPGDSVGSARTLSAIEDLVHKIKRIDWQNFVRPLGDDDSPAHAPGAEGALPAGALAPLLMELLNSTMEIHNVISDGFLSHQAHISRDVQTVLKGFNV